MNTGSRRWLRVSAILALTVALAAIGRTARPRPESVSAASQRSSTWTAVASPVGSDLYGVAAMKDGTLWTVGAEGTLLKFDGTQWIRLPGASARTLHAVTSADDGEAYAVGEGGTVLHLKNGEWRSFPGIPVTMTLYGVAARGEYVVAVGRGSDATAPLNTVAYQYVEGRWQAYMVLFAAAAELRSVAILGARSWLAVGAQSATSRLPSIAMSYDCSNLDLCRLASATGVAGALNDLSVTPSGDGLAVGAFRHILPRQAGAWSLDPMLSPSQPADEYRGVHSVSADEAWIVGDRGKIVHWQGAKAVEVASPTQSDLFDVTFTPLGIGWAVGAGGTILRYGEPSPAVASYLPAVSR